MQSSLKAHRTPQLLLWFGRGRFNHGPQPSGGTCTAAIGAQLRAGLTLWDVLCQHRCSGKDSCLKGAESSELTGERSLVLYL